MGICLLDEVPTIVVENPHFGIIIWSMRGCMARANVRLSFVLYHGPLRNKQ